MKETERTGIRQPDETTSWGILILLSTTARGAEGPSSLISHLPTPNSSRYKGDSHWKHVQIELHLKPWIKGRLEAGELSLLKRCT